MPVLLVVVELQPADRPRLVVERYVWISKVAVPTSGPAFKPVHVIAAHVCLGDVCSRVVGVLDGDGDFPLVGLVARGSAGVELHERASLPPLVQRQVHGLARGRPEGVGVSLAVALQQVRAAVTRGDVPVPSDRGRASSCPVARKPDVPAHRVASAGEEVVCD
eukprot:753796-Hanusia_phi.AAC.4